jgi:hypothetical protein
METKEEVAGEWIILKTCLRDTCPPPLRDAPHLPFERSEGSEKGVENRKWFLA